MATVTYSFEGGVSGNTVAAGAGAGPGDTNFDAVTNASATDTYDNTRAAHGTLSNKIATSATSTTSFNAWTTSIGTQTTVWVRAYCFFTAAPTVQHRVINFVGSAASRGNVLATTSGTFIFTNAAGGTVLTSAAFPLNSWFRIEAMFTGSATVGQWEYKIWNSPDSTGAPNDTQTSAANLATGGTMDTYRFGLGAAVANAGPYWLDDVGVSTTAYIGPAGAAAPAPPAAQQIPPGLQSPMSWEFPAGTVPPPGGVADMLPPSPPPPLWPLPDPPGLQSPMTWTGPMWQPVPDGGDLLPSGAFAGTAALSGVGSLTATPYFDPSPATLSGLGTLTAAPAFAGTTTMTGLGSLTAAPVFTGTASLSGSGTLSANPTAPANATLTGLGTLTAAPFFAETASLSGVGSLSATPAFTPVAALSGSGTLSAAPVFAATVTLSGVGTLTATPQLVGPVPSALLMVQQPRPPPPAPPPQILPGVQQDFLVVLGDMQPAQHTTAPPTVVAAQISALNPQPVYVLIAGDCTNDGDNTGFSGEFANFDSMYGGIKPILRPAPGNHDWGNVVGSGNLTAYDTYWGSQAHSGATPPHFYSFDTPTGWHVITFDSSEQWVGSLNNPSSTYTAIAADLAANKGKPIIAYWHHPRWSDGTNTTDPGGTGDTTVVQDIWNLLRDYACDLVFTGHCHSYQRFPKFGKTASADAQGIREFVVGTGGSGLFALTGAPGSPARSDVNSWQSAAYDQLNSQWFGFLKLWLTPSTYSWQFVSQNAAGSQNPGAILDSGGPVPTNLSLGATQGATTATLTGIGSLSATPVFAGTAPMSGVGSLTATPNFTGTANLTGQGTLSATETIGPVAGLSGAGTLTATPVFAGSASLSGQGTLTAAPVFAGTVPLSGVGTLSASPVFAVAASLSGVGTLSAAPTAPEQVTLSGLGTLSAAETLQVTAALSGAGTLSTTGGFSPSSTMSGLGTLTASPAKTVTVNLTGLGTLTATETLGTFPLLSGAGTLSAALRLGIGGGLAGLGTLTGTVTVTSPVLFGRGVAGQTPMPHAAAGQAAVAHGASGQTVTAHGAAGQVPVPFALAGQMATPHAEAGDV